MFRFRDRWQTSLGPLYQEPSATDRLLALLEDRDRELEDWLARAPAFGELPGLVSLTTSSWSNATTTETLVTGLTISRQLSRRRRYALEVAGRFASSVAGDSGIVRFYEDGVQRKAHVFPLPVAALGTSVAHRWTFVPASEDEVAYEVHGARLSGSGVISAVASGTTTIDFSITDVGPA